MVVNRVGPVSCGKVAAVLYGMLGLVVGTLISLGSMAGGLASESMMATGIGAAIGVAAIVVLPVVYACLGFVAALLGAWLYNAAASVIGGIEIDIA